MNSAKEAIVEERNPIERVFAECAEQGRAAFIPFLMAGDPDLATTGRLMEALAAGGADLIELGVPFSDPIADGPVNQRAATRALAAGTKLSGILELVARQRNGLGVPVVLFTYYNPLHARGVERFAEQAATSGVDGILCVDLPPEEAEATYLPALHAQGIDSVFLLAPTSSKERMDRVGEASRGFVYYVSRTGVTGERAAVPPELAREVKRVRRRVKLPVAVGFGISTPEQVAEVGRVADGVVVGSALVRLVEEHAGDPGLPQLLENRVRELAAPLFEPRRRRLFGR
ncbi:MAG TPA: tryptophan synthase subunit alpha [Thermoanaerobaculia bacterium]|nr:tryptophan synthase subunit alpha [Thermoanaerobaculia bacterium]